MTEEDALKKIGRGSLIILAGFILGTFFQYLYKMILARFLGPESFGVFVLGLAILQSVTAVAMFGLDSSIPRYISYYSGKESPEKMRKTVSTGLIIVTASSLLLSILLLIFSKQISVTIFSEPALATPLRIFSIAIPFLTLSKFVLTMFQGRQDAYRHALIDDFLWSGSLLLLVASSVLLGYQVIGAAVAYLVSTIVCFLAGVFIYLRNYRQRFTVSELNFRPLIDFTWPLFLISIFGITTRWFDILMIGWLVSSSESGVYEIAFSLAGYIALTLNIIVFMFMPVVSELYAKGNNRKIKEIYESSTRWMTTVNIPLIAGLLIFPEQIIELLFGSEYVKGSLAMMMLGAGFFYRVLKGPANVVLISTGRTRKLLGVQTVTVSLIILLNLLLIPEYGINGAAASTLIAFIIGDSLLLYIMKKQLDSLPYDKSFLKLFLAGAVAASIIALITYIFEPGIYISVLLGALLVFIYTILLLLIDGFRREDIELFRNILSRRLMDD